MTKGRSIRAIDACRIAGIDRQTFNEAVADGLYRHAPRTRGGSARLFSVDDIVPLRVFAELLKFGFRRSRAGQLVAPILKSGEVSDELGTFKFKFNLAYIKESARVQAGFRQESRRLQKQRQAT